MAQSPSSISSDVGHTSSNPRNITNGAETQLHAGNLPTRLELISWYVYGLCSYFVPTVLIPVIFPLIIADIASSVSPPSGDTIACSSRAETITYQRLVYKSIRVGGSATFSALQWTAISWAIGVAVAGPLLAKTARHLDHGHRHRFILTASTKFGSTFCLLTGFFRTTRIFPVYIAAIAISHTVSTAAHGRHLGLMVSGLLAMQRRAVASRLSLHVTAAGTAGAAVAAAFTYHMLRRSDRLTSMWVVSIFCGLAWLLGLSGSSSYPSPPAAPAAAVPGWRHSFRIYHHRQAAVGLVSVAISSFAITCVFTGGILHVVGELCIKPVTVFALWIIYYGFPVLSLPMMSMLPVAIGADAVRMQLLGFFFTAAATGTGFYYRYERWSGRNVLLVSLLQSTGAAVLQASGRVLVLDCSPAGEEGAFSAWHEWVRAAGACAGFGLAAAYPGDVRATFGAGFVAAGAGVFVLVFGNFGSRIGAGEEREVIRVDERMCVEEMERSTAIFLPV